MNINIGSYMDQNKKKAEAILRKITPQIMRQELRDNFADVERYLRMSGIYMTSDGRVAKQDIKKAIQALKKKIQYKTMTLEEFARFLA
jgi:Ribonuclease G/E